VCGWHSKVEVERSRIGAENFTKRGPDKSVAALLDEKAEWFAQAMRAKWEEMTRTHLSEWFKQSSNKELDERGSRASVSVEGLRHPGKALA